MDNTWSEDSIAKQLHHLYYAAGDSGSYGGVNRLLQRAREVGIPATREQVLRFLNGQLSYTLHRPVRHTFTRNHTYAARIDQQWQADLADMQSLAAENGGYRYILTCIDVLSRYAWAVPVKSKSSNDMLVAMKQLLRIAKPRKPERLQTDKGKEFFNAGVSGLLRQNGIHHFASNSDQKAAIVERFNRTLKNRLWTYFTANDTSQYIRVLGDIVDAYNRSWHRSIHMRPADVDTEAAAEKAWKSLYYYTDVKRKRPVRAQAPVDEGKNVRISRWKGEFEKGYLPNWSREHFSVQGRANHPQELYKLADASGEPIEGLFYRHEVQPVPHDTLQVERVLRRRRSRPDKREEVFVKWRGWPDKFNRWIPQADLKRYKLPPAERSRVNDDVSRESWRLLGGVAEQQ